MNLENYYTQQPICKEPKFIFNKDECLCMKKKKTLKLKRKLKLVEGLKRVKSPSDTKKRCPVGKVINPKTGRCNKIKPSTLKKGNQAKHQTLKLVLESVPDEKKISIQEKPNSNGTKRNVKTGKVHTPITVITDSNEVIVISSTTPALQHKLGNEIMELFSNTSKLKPTSHSIQKSIASFSPSINKELVSKRLGYPSNNLLGCTDFKTTTSPKIMVNGACVPYFSVKGKRALLENLSYSRKSLTWEDVTSPKQYQANCWFNVMFMVLFVSNKGRKFFKSFRQLMIEGKRSDGSIIKPPRLKTAFAYLNLAIEASLTPTEKILDNVDTNIMISSIYKSIPASLRETTHNDIINVGSYGNPYKYYKGIMDYLSYNPVSIYHHEHFSPGDEYYNVLNRSFEFYNLTNGGEIPDLIILSIFDKDWEKGTIEKKQIIKCGLNTEYKLDSCVIRDTKLRHFCALLEIDSTECGFDGGSFRKLSPFKWKTLLNKDTNWTFEGSTWGSSTENITWNFNKSYQMLFYYRIK